MATTDSDALAKPKNSGKKNIYRISKCHLNPLIGKCYSHRLLKYSKCDKIKIHESSFTDNCQGKIIDLCRIQADIQQGPLVFFRLT